METPIKLHYIPKPELDRNKLTKIVFAKNSGPSIEAKEVRNDHFEIKNTYDSRQVEFF